MTDLFRSQYKELTADQKQLITEIKEKATDIAGDFMEAPEGRCRSIALTKLEEAIMWIVKGISVVLVFMFILSGTAKADWICDAQSCYPAPPGYQAYIPDDINAPLYVEPEPAYYNAPIYDPVPMPHPRPSYTTRTGRTIDRRPIHNFHIQGKVIAERNCKLVGEHKRNFSLICR
jgi:hypothetical protein